MISGTRVSLRPVRDEDLDLVHRAWTDIETRGSWVPLPRTSLAAFRADFGQHGWWSKDEGLFLIVGDEDRVLGYVAWGTLRGSLPEIEVGYGIFDRAVMGRGIATEAVDLLVGYLFDAFEMNHLIAYIHPANAASVRVAEKCGFRREGTARQAWFNRGEWHDVDVYGLTRGDDRARRRAAAAVEAVTA